MARPLRINYPGAFYHVTSRGNERKAVFKSKRDREKFLEYLETATLKYNAVVHVYCLMDNHYHIFLETPSGNLPQIMRHINGAYTTYFNAKRSRSGHLFQGRYKAILVDADEYAKELSRYIHLNPVRADMVERPEEYTWSSLQDYIGARKPPEWLHRDFILGYFGNNLSGAEKEYKKFIRTREGKEYESPFKELYREIPAAKAFAEKPSLEDIFKGVDQEFSNGRLSRDVKQYLCHRYTDERLKTIGTHFGISESAVSHAVRRVVKNIEKDKKVRKRIDKLVNKLKPSRLKT
jgi:putative transposase